ncbi:platelet binding protein GspB-like [Periplaneta americana]|uniref:platelet binding protein GspB-like n=1 Tax=Periplaneta americana TaxID=6978 RepID=UPI0037E7641D
MIGDSNDGKTSKDLDENLNGTENHVINWQEKKLHEDAKPNKKECNTGTIGVIQQEKTGQIPELAKLNSTNKKEVINTDSPETSNDSSLKGNLSYHNAEHQTKKEKKSYGRTSSSFSSSELVCQDGSVENLNRNESVSDHAFIRTNQILSEKHKAGPFKSNIQISQTKTEGLRNKQDVTVNNALSDNKEPDGKEPIQHKTTVQETYLLTNDSRKICRLTMHRPSPPNIALAHTSKNETLKNQSSQPTCFSLEPSELQMMSTVQLEKNMKATADYVRSKKTPASKQVGNKMTEPVILSFHNGTQKTKCNQELTELQKHKGSDMRKQVSSNKINIGDLKLPNLKKEIHFEVSSSETHVATSSRKSLIISSSNVNCNKRIKYQTPKKKKVILNQQKLNIDPEEFKKPKSEPSKENVFTKKSQYLPTHFPHYRPTEKSYLILEGNNVKQLQLNNCKSNKVYIKYSRITANQFFYQETKEPECGKFKNGCLQKSQTDIVTKLCERPKVSKYIDSAITYKKQQSSKPMCEKSKHECLKKLQTDVPKLCDRPKSTTLKCEGSLKILKVSKLQLPIENSKTVISQNNKSEHRNNQKKPQNEYLKRKEVKGSRNLMTRGTKERMNENWERKTSKYQRIAGDLMEKCKQLKQEAEKARKIKHSESDKETKADKCMLIVNKLKQIKESEEELDGTNGTKNIEAIKESKIKEPKPKRECLKKTEEQIKNPKPKRECLKKTEELRVQNKSENPNMTKRDPPYMKSFEDEETKLKIKSESPWKDIRDTVKIRKLIKSIRESINIPVLKKGIRDAIDIKKIKETLNDTINIKEIITGLKKGFKLKELLIGLRDSFNFRTLVNSFKKGIDLKKIKQAVKNSIDLKKLKEIIKKTIKNLQKSKRSVQSSNSKKSNNEKRDKIKIKSETTRNYSYHKVNCNQLRLKVVTHDSMMTRTQKVNTKISLQTIRYTCKARYTKQAAPTDPPDGKNIEEDTRMNDANELLKSRQKKSASSVSTPNYITPTQAKGNMQLIEMSAEELKIKSKLQDVTCQTSYHLENKNNTSLQALVQSDKPKPNVKKTETVFVPLSKAEREMQYETRDQDPEKAIFQPKISQSTNSPQTNTYSSQICAYSPNAPDQPQAFQTLQNATHAPQSSLFSHSSNSDMPPLCSHSSHVSAYPQIIQQTVTKSYSHHPQYASVPPQQSQSSLPPASLQQPQSSHAAAYSHHSPQSNDQIPPQTSESHAPFPPQNLQSSFAPVIFQYPHSLHDSVPLQYSQSSYASAAPHVSVHLHSQESQALIPSHPQPSQVSNPLQSESSDVSASSCTNPSHMSTPVHPQPSLSAPLHPQPPPVPASLHPQTSPVLAPLHPQPLPLSAPLHPQPLPMSSPLHSQPSPVSTNLHSQSSPVSAPLHPQPSHVSASLKHPDPSQVSSPSHPQSPYMSASRHHPQPSNISAPLYPQPSNVSAPLQHPHLSHVLDPSQHPQPSQVSAPSHSEPSHASTSLYLQPSQQSTPLSSQQSHVSAPLQHSQVSHTTASLHSQHSHVSGPLQHPQATYVSTPLQNPQLSNLSATSQQPQIPRVQSHLHPQSLHASAPLQNVSDFTQQSQPIQNHTHPCQHIQSSSHTLAPSHAQSSGEPVSISQPEETNTSTVTQHPVGHIPDSPQNSQNQYVSRSGQNETYCTKPPQSAHFSISPSYPQVSHASVHPQHSDNVAIPQKTSHLSYTSVSAGYSHSSGFSQHQTYDSPSQQPSSTQTTGSSHYPHTSVLPHPVYPAYSSVSEQPHLQGFPQQVQIPQYPYTSPPQPPHASLNEAISQHQQHSPPSTYPQSPQTLYSTSESPQSSHSATLTSELQYLHISKIPSHVPFPPKREVPTPQTNQSENIVHELNEADTDNKVSPKSTHLTKITSEPHEPILVHLSETSISRQSSADKKSDTVPDLQTTNSRSEPDQNHPSNQTIRKKGFGDIEPETMLNSKSIHLSLSSHSSKGSNPKYPSKPVPSENTSEEINHTGIYDTKKLSTVGNELSPQALNPTQGVIRPSQVSTEYKTLPPKYTSNQSENIVHEPNKTDGDNKMSPKSTCRTENAPEPSEPILVHSAETSISRQSSADKKSDTVPNLQTTNLPNVSDQNHSSNQTIREKGFADIEPKTMSNSKSIHVSLSSRSSKGPNPKYPSKLVSAENSSEEINHAGIYDIKKLSTVGNESSPQALNPTQGVIQPSQISSEYKTSPPKDNTKLESDAVIPRTSEKSNESQSALSTSDINKKTSDTIKASSIPIQGVPSMHDTVKLKTVTSETFIQNEGNKKTVNTTSTKSDNTKAEEVRRLREAVRAEVVRQNTKIEGLKDAITAEVRKSGIVLKQHVKSKNETRVEPSLEDKERLTTSRELSKTSATNLIVKALISFYESRVQQIKNQRNVDNKIEAAQKAIQESLTMENFVKSLKEILIKGTKRPGNENEKTEYLKQFARNILEIKKREQGEEGNKYYTKDNLKSDGQKYIVEDKLRSERVEYSLADEVRKGDYLQSKEKQYDTKEKTVTGKQKGADRTIAESIECTEDKTTSETNKLKLKTETLSKDVKTLITEAFESQRKFDTDPKGLNKFFKPTAFRSDAQVDSKDKLILHNNGEQTSEPKIMESEIKTLEGFTKTPILIGIKNTCEPPIKEPFNPDTPGRPAVKEPCGTDIPVMQERKLIIKEPWDPYRKKMSAIKEPLILKKTRESHFSDVSEQKKTESKEPRSSDESGSKNSDKFYTSGQQSGAKKVLSSDPGKKLDKEPQEETSNSALKSMRKPRKTEETSSNAAQIINKSQAAASSSSFAEPEFSGLAKYFNSETIRGRANVSKATFALLGVVGMLYFAMKPKPNECENKDVTAKANI